MLGNERGTQTIEFAIVFPSLILLFAGTTELGRLFYTYNSLAKATRGGARYLSSVADASASATAAKNVVLCGNPGGCGGTGQPAIILPNLSASNVVVTLPATSGTGPKYVTISITGYNYRPVVFDLSAMTGANFVIPINVSTTMRYMHN
jgi:Flp pilus assembly protein TadG